MNKRALAGLILSLAILWGCAKAPAELPTEPNPAPVAEPTPSEPAPGEPTPAPPQPPPPAPPPEPEPSVLIEPAQVQQGDIATLQLTLPVQGPVKVQVEGLGEQPKLFVHEGRAVAFVGIPAAARVGDYPVTVTWEGGQWQGTLEVVHKAFTEDRLIVTQEQEELYYDPRSAEEWRRVYALRAQSMSYPQWDGTFALPLEGDLYITTYFGEIRFVNGVETGRHSGMDFGAPTGTPIYAPAAGRVILSEPLILTGNMVIIDHGYNLFTAYYHCEDLLVEPGQYVQRGDLIATVGSTGFSTGPHLHWTATIGNTPVDPWPLTQAPPLGWRAPSVDRTE